LEPGFHPLRVHAPRPPGEQRPVTWQRVLKWVALAVGAWLALSLLMFLVSAELQRDNVSQEARTALDEGGLTLTSNSTILVLGSDARPRNARDCPESGCGPSRADTIMLVRAGPGKSSRLSIPRDTIADIPGHGRDKINAAYAIGGPALAITTVKRFLDIPVNHVIEVNFENFPEFIDSMGGIKVKTGCIESNISGGEANGGSTLKLKAGTNHLTGDQALDLARTRANACRPNEGDEARARRQQAILQGINSRLRSPFTFVRLPLLSWNAPKAIRTDMGGPSLLGLFAVLQTAGSPPTQVLRPSGGEVLPDGGAGLVVTEEEKRTAVERFLRG
jgi:LCP family protein required for cell wall assembly